MKQKKIPKRLCVSCREMKPKKELLRVVKTADGEVVSDPTGKVLGRGAYICKDKNCFLSAKKRKALDRVLEKSISEEVYDNLQKEIEKE